MKETELDLKSFDLHFAVPVLTCVSLQKMS